MLPGVYRVCEKNARAERRNKLLRKETIMEKTRSGMEIIKSEINHNIGVKVSLTRKTTKSGKIRHAVVITNPRSGLHTRLKSFEGIGGAWELYKRMMAV